MNPTAQPASEPPAFSERPALHYFLTICIVALMTFPIVWNAGYNCLSAGDEDRCYFDIIMLQAVGWRGSGAGIELMLKSFLVTLVKTLAFLLVVLASHAPVFSLAVFTSRRFRIRQNAAGVLFWIAAWMMAALTLPTFALVSLAYDPEHLVFGSGPVPWSEAILMMILFGVTGAIYGIIYCLIACRHRIVARIIRFLPFARTDRRMG
jgi:hypothetical protein